MVPQHNFKVLNEQLETESMMHGKTKGGMPQVKKVGDVWFGNTIE